MAIHFPGGHWTVKVHVRTMLRMSRFLSGYLQERGIAAAAEGFDNAHGRGIQYALALMIW